MLFQFAKIYINSFNLKCTIKSQHLYFMYAILQHDTKLYAWFRIASYRKLKLTKNLLYLNTHIDKFQLNTKLKQSYKSNNNTFELLQMHVYLLSMIIPMLLCALKLYGMINLSFYTTDIILFNFDKQIKFKEANLLCLLNSFIVEWNFELKFDGVNN